MVPTVVLPPARPFTCQVTAVLFVFCTVAVNCRLPLIGTVAEVGKFETVIAGGGPPHPEMKTVKHNSANNAFFMMLLSVSTTDMDARSLPGISDLNSICAPRSY